ncbi:MAG: hypothetical protein ACOYB4_09710 [Methyloceanibacter sp.]
MEQFLARHQEKIIGVLSGLDRILFRGTLRQLAYGAGMQSFLNYRRILLKDFAGWAESISERIRAESAEIAEAAGRPLRYLASSQVRKHALVQEIVRRSPVEAGLICVLSCVEPCVSYEVHRSRERRRLELERRLRKCLHLYHYFLDPQFGLMHVRLQTWAPFTVQVCLNGREWLARQLSREGIAYQQRENCFVGLANFARAQALCDAQLATAWATTLDGLRRRACPSYDTWFNDVRTYWSMLQVEWATDVLFDTPATLGALYPHLTRHAITHFSSADVMRFLGRKLRANFQGEIVSDYGQRPEGVRVKHRLGANSLKIYDKQQRILRVETTVHNVRELKAFRRPEGRPSAPPAWRRMSTGVANLHRLAEISQTANARYLDALAQLETRTPVAALVDTVCRPTTRRGRRHRGLRPWDPLDTSVLIAINRGEFVVKGFRNRDLRGHVFPTARTAVDRKRAAGRVTRLLGLLRAHAVIKKIPKTHRYQLTDRGRLVVTAVLAARNAELSALLKMAA